MTGPEGEGEIPDPEDAIVSHVLDAIRGGESPDVVPPTSSASTLACPYWRAHQAHAFKPKYGLDSAVSTALVLATRATPPLTCAMYTGRR